ncbi:hypothetical protein AMECASPLE_026007 [Ameca splendens]|uniref:Integrase core domain-containing protein n=1 Tax=Ameca splendens TaxID=208324 RepID=A0ABV0Z3M3_9TELE
MVTPLTPIPPVPCPNSCFYQVLYDLEEEGYLNLSNSLHILCCKYVFLPPVQQHLNIFRDGWDYHPLSTEGNLSHNQLWHIRQPYPSQECNKEIQVPQIEWESSGLIPSEPNSGVLVPEVECPLSPCEFSGLSSTVNPLSVTTLGVDYYLATL